MDKDTRNQIQRATQQGRALLEQDYAAQLEGVYDIRPDGTISPKPGAHLDAAQRVIRRKLVAAIGHQQSHFAKTAEAVDAYLREAAFTTLNRFVALKMLEARSLVQECLSRGEQSSGFKEFTGLAPGLVQLPDHGYRLYIECLFDEIGREVKVLFDRTDPASLLWPRRQTLNDLLAILNADNLAGVWGEDETIGWVYQYFNSDEERKQMRAESPAPRNSRELAVRNQFFTPRYVVEFLTDNTLGRIWYEMRQGDTRLMEECDYLVRRPSEVFLAAGEAAPVEPETEEDLSQEELLKKTVYIPFRAKKDPRDLKVLDPACGSGHFLLYSFDLLLTIYEEGWTDEASPSSEATGRSLREDYSTLEELRAAVPGLILRYNLHGIDIDPRAAQIASLALWMRAQRAYNEFEIARKERMPIRKTNVVVAEPMPGNAQQLEEFVASLDRQLGQLTHKVFKKMELAGEAGSLLKIEEEIQSAVREIYPEFGGIYRAQDEERWVRAEARLLEALKTYSGQAESSHAYRRRLFVEDTERGLAFIDVCRQRYDAVLMNPPFGLPQEKLFEWYKEFYENTYVDLYASAVVRGSELAPQGLVGAITSRSFLTAKKLTRWRSTALIDSLQLLADFGLGVMDDAYVQSAAYVLNPKNSQDFFDAFNCSNLDQKDKEVRHAIKESSGLIHVEKGCIRKLPNTKLLYSVPQSIYRLLSSKHVFEPNIGTAREGMRTFDDFRFVRLRWEVNPKDISPRHTWEPLAKGGEFSKFYSDIHLLVKWNQDGRELAEQNRNTNGQIAQSRQASDYYRLSGATYSKRSVKGFSVRVLPEGCIIGTKGPAILSLSNVKPAYLVGWLNSRLINFLVTLQANFGEYNTGIIKRLPWLYAKSSTELEDIAMKAILAKRTISSSMETNSLYLAPKRGSSLQEVYEQYVLETTSLLKLIDEAQSAWDNEIDAIYGVNSRLSNSIECEEPEVDDSEDSDEDVSGEVFSIESIAASNIFYAVGTVFGRWDIRIGLDDSLRPILPDPFEQIPACPPGSLKDTSGFPAGQSSIPSEDYLRVGNSDDCHIRNSEALFDPIEESNYPLQVSWLGILVDDEGVPNDLVAQVQEVLHLLGGKKSNDLEEEICQAIGVKSIRQFFRNGGKVGFWGRHLQTYSKSRRKAPIYWQLSVPSVNYSVWLYYHRFTKDTFYTVLNDYIKPKLFHEETQLTRLIQEAGPNPSASQRKDIAAQEAFVAELRAFRDEVAIIAPLWNPNLNDGVIINFAPLWRLVPHHRAWQKECKACWDKLVAGDYDWAHLAMHLWPERVVPKCKTDRSLAIAHGLEGEFWQEDPSSGKWQPRKVSKEVCDQLIQERTSPAVKDALKKLLSAPAPGGAAKTRSRKSRS